MVYILGILIALLFFSIEKNGEKSNACTALTTSEAVVQKEACSDMQTQIAVLSKDLKDNHLLTPRRTFTSVTQNITIREYDGVSRILQYFRLKGGNILEKVQEKETYTQTIYFSTLFCRMAHHVFVMRKLLI